MNSNDHGRPSKRLTYNDAVKIRAMLSERWIQSRIAAYFDVNPGRISEINTGKRFPVSKGVR